MSNDFKEAHLKTTAPSKYRRLYESALRAHEAMDEHRKVIAEVGPDPLTGRRHSQACWAGGLRWGSADLSGSMCWCGLQHKPEPPPEMREELTALLGDRINADNGPMEAFLNKWGVVLAGELHAGTVK